jgi:hypothetical protein
MLRQAGLVLLPILALATGCAAPADEESVSDESAYTQEDAACFNEAPQSGESKTDARARCLTAQASRLIDAQIARAEDPRDRAIAAFKGKLRVAGETGCFTEDVSGSAVGAWQNDIDSERDVGMIGVQLKATVEFLKYFYRDLDGYPNHFFQSIEVCPNGQVGRDLALTGARLRVGIRTGYFGRVGIHTSTQLRDKWTNGEHLDGNAALEQLKGIRWSILDPVGTPRTTLRKALRGIVARLTARLGGLAGKPESTVRQALTQLVREETSAAVVDDQDRNIRDRALAKVAAMTGAQLAKLAKNWKLEIEKTEIAEGAEEGSVSMRDVLNHRDVNVKVAQTGFVNVQNYKQISVDTEVFLPGSANFSRYVEATKSETNIEVEQYGFVNIQLNDVITVRVQILYGKTSQTASLDRLLGP